MQKILIAILFIGSIGFSAYVVSLSPNTSVTEVSPTAASFSSASALTHDWGDINIAGGDVTQVFTLTNSESEPMLLSGAVTSCMCTTADFILSDASRSGEFGMHGGPDWSHMVQPGESFDVEVTFDPMAHGPTATGPINRTVNVLSKGDATDSSVVYTRIDVRGDVLSESDYLSQNE